MISIAPPLFAQPRPAPATAPVKIEVLRSVGTAGEAPQIQAVTDRVKGKFAGDAAYAERIDAALARRDQGTVKSLIADVARVRADQVWIGLPPGLSLGDERQPIVRFASFERAPYNPFFVMFIVANKYAVCVGGTQAQCDGAIRGAGYRPVS
jgi:hypothetical protein